MAKLTKLCITTSIFVLSFSSSVQAQITLDGTMNSGKSGPIDPNNGTYLIEAEFGSLINSNLYHSFGEFSVPTDHTAHFTGPNNVANVISRVTGEKLSSIEGRIHSDMPNADFYLINPNGIVFGNKASLDVPRSFYASTADQINFKDGKFSATNFPTNSILSAESPESFGFLDANQAPISVDGSFLEVSEGNTLSLVGGGNMLVEGKSVSLRGSAVHIEGTEISSSNGQILIDSKTAKTQDIPSPAGHTVLSSPAGHVQLVGKTKNQLKIDKKSTEAGDITVKDSRIDATTVENSSTIFFRGGKLMVEHSRVNATSEKAESQIEIDATHASLLNNSRINITTSTKTDKRNSTVVIGKGNLKVLEVTDSSITTIASGGESATDVPANAGDVFITADTKVILSGKSGEEATINVETFGQGNGGNIRIDTSLLKMQNGAVINGKTSGAGKGADVQIRTKGDIILSDKSHITVATTGTTMGSGDAGKLTINTDGKLQMTDSAIAADTRGTGKGDLTEIEAKENITMSNSSMIFATLGEIRGNKLDSNQAGSLNIHTNSLSLNNSYIATGTAGVGNGGDTTINAADVKLTGSGILSLSLGKKAGSGNAGFLTINASNLTVENSTIAAGTVGTGNGGDVRIKANKVELSGDFLGFKNVYSVFGDKLFKFVTTTQNIRGKLEDVPLFSITVGTRGETLNSGNASSVRIDANNLKIFNNAAISAATFGTGAGGNIKINVKDSIYVANGNIFTTTMGLGKGGFLEVLAGQEINLLGTGYFLGREPWLFSTIDVSTRELNSGDAGSLTLGAHSVGKYPNINLYNGASISSATFGQGKGGFLKLHAKNLNVVNSNIIATTLGSGKGGSIELLASEEIRLSKPSNILGGKRYNFSSIDVSSCAVKNSCVVNSGGDAGNLIIGPLLGTRPKINIQDGASISSATFNIGQGGNIQVEAEHVKLEKNARISAESKGKGNAGSINLDATQFISLDDNSHIEAIAIQSVGGTIALTTPNLIMNQKSSMNTNIEKNARQGGDILVTVNTLTLDDASLTSSSHGRGPSGSLAIRATDYVNIFGSKAGIFSTTSDGKGGNIHVSTSKLNLSDSGRIDASSSATGMSGNVFIGADELSLQSGSVISATSAMGKAGKVNIKTSIDPQSHIMLKDSRITTESKAGEGGRIDINTPTLTVNNGTINATVLKGNKNASPANINIAVNGLTLENKGRIESSTKGKAPGGGIVITASEYINIFGNQSIENNSGIFSEGTGDGSAGTIIIGRKPPKHSGKMEAITLEKSSSWEKELVPTLILQGGGQISTTAQGRGNSGSIELLVDNLQVNDGTITSVSKIGRPEPLSKQANIRLEVNTLTLGDEFELTKMGRIESSTEGHSRGGNITITASEYIKIFGNEQSDDINPKIKIYSGIYSESGESGSQNADVAGASGNITIKKSPLLTLEKDGKISTTAYGVGDGGSIDIKIDDLKVTEGSITSTSESEVGSSEANPANIVIDVKRLTLGVEPNENSDTTPNLTVGRIETSTKGASPGGNIIITASEYIKIFGNNPVDDNQENSGIFSESENAGAAGTIIIGRKPPKSVHELTPEDVKKSSTWEKASPMLKTLTLTGQGKISTTAKGSGDSGSIDLVVDDLNVTDGSITSISKTGRTDANPANITIEANELTLGVAPNQEENNVTPSQVTVGRIETSTKGASPGGNIIITASEYINIFGNNPVDDNQENSGIFSESENAGAAGTIIIGRKPLKSVYELTPEDVKKSSTWEKASPMLKTLTLTGQGEISTTAKGTGDSGSIDLVVEDLNVTEGSITSISQTGRTGANPANIVIDVKHLTLGVEPNENSDTTQTVGRIETSTEGKSPGGNIIITASEYINIFGNNQLRKDEDNSGIFSESESESENAGAAGTIIIGRKLLKPVHELTIEDEKSSEWEKVSVPTLTLEQGGQISTTAKSNGDSGQINIVAGNLEITDASISAVSQEGSSDATPADITIEVDKLTLQQLSDNTSTTQQTRPALALQEKKTQKKGGIIESSTTGQSPAGNITITASQYIKISGDKSGIVSEATHTGKAGEIDILAGGTERDPQPIATSKNILEATNEANETNEVNKARAFVPKLSEKAIEEQGLLLDNKAKISTSTRGQGDGGNINIATSHLQLQEDALIEANETGNASIAGNIIIGTKTLDMSDSTISTTAEGAKGGNILIGVNKITGDRDHRIINSTITASVKKGTGDGGNLEILGKPPYLVLEHTNITAQADEKKGGNIEIDALVFIKSLDSEVSASSNEGIDGEENIDSAQVNIESISLLPSRTVDASKLIKDCVAAASEEQWSIVKIGHEVTSERRKQKNIGCN